MNIIHKIEIDKTKEREDALKGLERVSGNVEKNTKELEDRASCLPIVEEDGSSECPFAEDLYAQKEEVEEKLKSALLDLNGRIPFLAQEISRCRNNLKQMSSDREKLVLEAPKNSYSSAEQEQKTQLRDVIKIQMRINDILKRAKLVLEIAEAEKFPGRKPQRKGFSPGASSPSSLPVPLREPVAIMAPPIGSPGGTFPVGPVISNPGPGLGGETGGILSTGPLK